MARVSDPASLNQTAAADPASSVWLHANAGSGKTKVLIDRVARLLLSGVEPQHVLCLTYTKAAAAEMQNRLFARLGAWAMMPDAKLVTALVDLGPLDGQKTPDIARARQLFARAIETPGGLRIQTIHSFCATILRRFPLEAGVSPNFTDLDDRSGILMRSEIAQGIASGPHAATFDAVAQVYTGDDLDALLAQIAKARNGMERFLDKSDVFAMFGVPPHETPEGILADVFFGNERDFIDTVMPHLDPDHRNEGSWLKRFMELPQEVANLESLKVLETLVLSGPDTKNPSKAKVGKFPNATARAALGDKVDAWDAFMQRVGDARPRRTALAAATKTTALHGFARHFIPAYAKRKAALGTLDFDDQITRAKALLSHYSVAQWVLYRLDGGIDHILVDEAQDTSPDQWEVLERLTDAFMDGDTTRSRARTIFVVGDKKQSIYSFQGADLAAFDAMKVRFGGRLSQAGQALQERDMLHSFRSSQAILQVVDATFDRDVTDSVGGRMQHIAFFDRMPGRVEVWPLIEAETAEADTDGFSPVDLTTDEHHAIRMGNTVADWISGALASGMQVPTRDGVKVAEPGDFLVLVQRRSKIFNAVIAACKKRHLAIAGADRLVLGEELAVKDVMALLSFLATDTDDLSLAIVLRSPLGGLSEDDLYRLAQGREGILWLELVKQAARYPAVSGMLDDLRSVAELLRPYDLMERALTRHGGRLRLTARLGQEAEDAIDELLTQALAYEAAEVPSITGFLSWLGAGDVQVKRQMEAGGGQIRVMTVHGAKGLEAPVVILPDTADHSANDRDEVIALEPEPEVPGANGPPERRVIWATSSADSPDVVRDEKVLRKAKRAAEDDRLLYVAMTRAQSLLVVGAAGRIGKDSTCWHRKISEGMERVGATMGPAGELVHAFGVWPGNGAVQMPKVAGTVLPGWAKSVVVQPVDRVEAISPSNLGGSKVLLGEAGQDVEIAMERGGRLHVLLEHLPVHDPADWAAIAAALQSENLLTEARAVLERHPALFAPGTLSEVAITAELGGRRMVGSIDRLVVGPDFVLAVDFKSNRVVPARGADVPEGILRQMGAYAAALAQIYPEKRIETAILWTQTADLLRLDPDIVSAALSRALSLDVPAPGA